MEVVRHRRDLLHSRFSLCLLDGPHSTCERAIASGRRLFGARVARRASRFDARNVIGVATVAKIWESARRAYIAPRLLPRRTIYWLEPINRYVLHCLPHLGCLSRVARRLDERTGDHGRGTRGSQTHARVSWIVEHGVIGGCGCRSARCRPRLVIERTTALLRHSLCLGSWLVDDSDDSRRSNSCNSLAGTFEEGPMEHSSKGNSRSQRNRIRGHAVRGRSGRLGGGVLALSLIHI